VGALALPQPWLAKKRGQTIASLAKWAIPLLRKS